MKVLNIVLFVVFVLISCRKVEDMTVVDYNKLDKILIPQGFSDINFPIGNEFTSDRWVLGKKLFYDKRLSLDSTLSCGSCHKPEFAFGDNQPTTNGVKNRPGTRNVPSLANVAYHPYYTREGGLPTLEMQMLVPIQEHNEFDFNLVLIVERLKNDIDYKRLSQSAYDKDLDAFSITRSITNFERSILSGNSTYDLYINGKQNALTQNEKLGKDLFFSDKTNCSKCHGGFNFTDYGFKNNGIYENYKDLGRFRLTQLNEDVGVFKTPSLRNIGLTAPYMHDGSLKTIEEVIDHYNSGGKLHQNKSQLIKSLNLSDSEKENLRLFLLTLTDNSLVQNKYLQRN
jgi:cytochrome c peroxidase